MKNKLSGLNKFISKLREKNELVEIFEFVDPNFEIAEITDRVSKSDNGGKAILFHNTGLDYPVVTNLMGSDTRIALLLGIADVHHADDTLNNIINQLISPKETLRQKISTALQLIHLSSNLPRKHNKKGECQAFIDTNPKLSTIPVIRCWPDDGGPFITLPLVHTISPVNNIANVGMYRMQVMSDNETGMHWHMHKGGAKHYQEYKKMGKRMPVSVAIGGDPIYSYVATAPLPENIDEYIFAGILRNKQVDLVKCITNDIYVPSDVDFVIEGYIDTNEPLVWEGPFGDHTGFYSLADWYPKFHVTCITHKKDAIYPATLVGVPPQEDFYIAKATERIFLPLLQKSILPELENLQIPAPGVGHNITIASIDATYPGHALKVRNALWGAGQMMFNKILVVVQKDTRTDNLIEFANHLFVSVDISKDISLSRGPLDVLDHSTDTTAFGGKLCIDATNHRNIKYDIDKIDENAVLSKNNDIAYIRQDLLGYGMPFVVVGVRKKRQDVVAEVIKDIESLNLKGVQYFAITDYDLSQSTWYYIVWLLANNINPDRDTYLRNNKLFFDCTSKSKSLDGFNKEWPNVVVSSAEVIKTVDEKWTNLGIGKLIESPSNKICQIKLIE